MSIKDVVAKYKKEANVSEMEDVVEFLKKYEKVQSAFATMYPRFQELNRNNVRLSQSFARDIARRFDLDPEETRCDLIIDDFRGTTEFEVQLILQVPDDISPSKMSVIEDYLKEVFGNDVADISEADELMGFTIFHAMTDIG